MKHASIDLIQFQKRFSNERACMDHLFRLRWPDGFSCPRCGTRRYSLIRSRRLYQCRACRYQASVTAGTVFHKTRTPIHKWFWMIFMMTRQKSGVSILRMQALLGIGSYKTAWLMGHKIRKGMADRDSLHELAELIEMGDSFSSTRDKDKTDQNTGPQSTVIAAIAKDGARLGKCTMHVADATELDFVLSSLKERMKALGPTDGSTEQSDSMSARSKEPARFRWVNTAIANLKGNLRGVHHGVSRKHLQRYLSEFFYRLNRRRCDSELFNRAVVACIRASRTTWAEVTS